MPDIGIGEVMSMMC